MAKGNEDDLLADAIPIDLSESDMLEDAIPIDQVTEAAPASDGIDLAGDDSAAPRQQIRTFDSRKKTGDEDSKYQRKPQGNGTGGVRAKTFVAKLRLDAIEHLDHQINEWLDAHPHYEVKLVSTTVGELTGKIKEPALFMTVFI